MEKEKNGQRFGVERERGGGGGWRGAEGGGGGCSGADAAVGDLWKERRNLAEPQPLRHGRVRDTGTQEEDRRR